MGEFSGLSGWAQCNPKSLKVKERGGRGQNQREVYSWDNGQRGKLLPALEMEERSHERRNVAGKGRKINSPLERNSLADTLI